MNAVGTAAIVSRLFTVVGQPKRAGLRGERRLEPRLAALALERVEQRRLLAADVRARAGVDDDVDRVVLAEGVLAEVALRLGLLDRAPEALLREVELVAHVDVRDVRADGVAADDAALDARSEGSPPSSVRSLCVPGSPSSALMTR